MAIQTYCTRSDLEAIVADFGVDQFVDDDRDGLISATEETYVTAAIRRAANKINFKLNRRYKRADLTGNEWLLDVNAVLAVCELMQRRGNPLIDSLQANCDEYMNMLDDIQQKQADIPDLAPSVENIGSVSNFRAERWRGVMKVRVVRPESTGADPEESRQRKTSVTKRERW